MLSQLYSENRILMNTVTQINNLFIQLNGYKKEIEYLSVEEFFDSMTQSIKYEMKKMVIKFCTEVLVNKIGETCDKRTEWRQESRKIVAQVRTK